MVSAYENWRLGSEVELTHLRIESKGAVDAAVGDNDPDALDAFPGGGSGGSGASTHATRTRWSPEGLGPTVIGMSGRAMAVTFHKRGRGCGWTAVRPPRSIVPGPTMAAGGDLPHDLYTFVIEDALDIEHGFWGCVAAGATFKTLGRKRTPQGKAVIARHLDELDEAEARVNEVYFAWRAGTATDLDDELSLMLDRWRGLPDGGDLVVEWAIERPFRRRARHRPPSR